MDASLHSAAAIAADLKCRALATAIDKVSSGSFRAPGIGLSGAGRGSCRHIVAKVRPTAFAQAGMFPEPDAICRLIEVGVVLKPPPGNGRELAMLFEALGGLWLFRSRRRAPML